jgi:hypothetical protein
MKDLARPEDVGGRSRRFGPEPLCQTNGLAGLRVIFCQDSDPTLFLESGNNGLGDLLVYRTVENHLWPVGSILA